MNDLKTEQRERMSQQVLKNLMLWHVEAKDLLCRDLPVMSILKEWRALATGPRGRKAHRPAEVPKYEYERNRSTIGKSKE